MYPDLSYILHAIIGTEPDNFFSIFQTFGMLLVVTFIVAAFLLRIELKRKYENGQLKATEVEKIQNPKVTSLQVLWQAIIGFVLGAKVVYAFLNFDLFKSSPADILLSMDGNLIGGILGALVLGGMKFLQFQKTTNNKEVKNKVLVKPQDRVWDITIVAAISGIAGAKIFALFESAETWANFTADPINTLLSGSGLAIYGGLIVAFTVEYFYLKSIGLKPIHVMDAVAPSLIAGYGVGRIGCQLSGDGDWGIESGPSPDWWFLPESLWSQTYAHNVIDRGEAIAGCTWEHCNELTAGVFPTPLYETFMALIIFLILWGLRKKINWAGFIFFLYVFFNGVERWFIEKIRVNDKIEMFGMELTQAQIISFALIFIGIVGMIISYQRAQKNKA